jgi:glutathione-regulated potassium-efflux system ancillary protein KefC
VAVVYAVMLELGFNQTSFGKGILASCFINDLGTVIGLGLIFSPFTMRTLIFIGVSLFVFILLPFVTPWLFDRFGGRVSELEAKWILLLSFGLGSLAAWAGSEAVLPAYILGIVLAGTVGKDHILIRRLRTMTFGLLTPFYFIRAGSLVSIPALIAAPMVFLALLLAKMFSKMAALVPTVRAFNYLGHEGLYYSLMMSTGLTFGTISALFVLNHGIINQIQYSHLVATVIGSAVVPTAIANAYFMPKHLLPQAKSAEESGARLVEQTSEEVV